MDLGRTAGIGGVEPRSSGWGLVHETDRSLRISYGDVELTRYVYRPWEPPVESPRPYLHPVRTMSGELVSLYRPHDHVWHKGLAWSFSNVDDENFWGGPTWVRGEGYRLLDNHGTTRHDSWLVLQRDDAVVRCRQELTWVGRDGRELIREQRVLEFTAETELSAWCVTLGTELTNISDRPIVFGSPGTRGRPDGGYGGLVWRGPRSFTDGRLVTPGGVGGDELMGTRAAWMGYVGRHDGAGSASTVLFVDSADNPGHPTQWFARTQRYAVLGPAPFFSAEHRLEPGSVLALRYRAVVADGPADVERCTALATRFAAEGVSP